MKRDVTGVLMNRDGMSKAEADSYYDDVMSEMMDAISCGDFDVAESIFESDFGLEMDYFI